MTVIAQDDHLTAGAWAPCEQTDHVHAICHPVSQTYFVIKFHPDHEVLQQHKPKDERKA